MKMEVPACSCDLGGLCECGDYSAFILAESVLEEISSMYANYPEAVSQMGYRRLEGFKTYVLSMIAGDIDNDVLELQRIATELRDRKGYPRALFKGVYLGWSGLTC